MALSNEDKKDVAGALGKKMANKVSKVTRDRNIAESQIVPKDVRMKFLHGDRTGKPGAKSKALKEKMKEGIHRVGSNPSRFVHREPGGKFDLYESWKGGKQSFKRTTNKDH